VTETYLTTGRVPGVKSDEGLLLPALLADNQWDEKQISITGESSDSQLFCSTGPVVLFVLWTSLKYPIL